MSAMIIWGIGLGVSTAALVVTAASRMFLAHMAIAALVSVLVALSSFRATRAGAAGLADTGDAMSTALRHMGIIWTWGALSLLVTYAFDILSWREWWQFFMAFFVLAGLSLFLAATVGKDASVSAGDVTLIKVARGFSIFIMVAMVITMAGLLIDGKMWRFTTEAGLRRGSQDWAANNVFFFGAMALAAIGWDAMKISGRQLAGGHGTQS
jgi:hypothetical protein